MKPEMPNVTFAIFKNQERNLFHIRSTVQKDYRKYVTVSDAYGKAKYTLDSDQTRTRSSNSESFQWYIFVSGPADWTVEYVELGEISSSQQKEKRKEYNAKIEAEGYRNCSPRCDYVHSAMSILNEYTANKNINGFWKARKLANIKSAEMKDIIESMLDACEVSEADIKDFARIESRYVNYGQGRDTLENIGDLARYILDGYHQN